MIDKFIRKVENAKRQFVDEGLKVPKRINKVLFTGGNDIRNDIIRNMQKTAKAKHSYKRGGKRHHPSLPGNYPAIDGGRLKGDISFNVFKNKMEIGSSLKYAEILEERKDIGKRRLWLMRTVEKHEKKIMEGVSEVIPDAITNVMKEME
jgi:hypothetical protein